MQDMTLMQSLRHRPRQFMAWLVFCVATVGLMPLAYAGAGPDAGMPEWCSASMSASGWDAAKDLGAPAAGQHDLGGLAVSGHHCALCAMGDVVALPSALELGRSFAAPTAFIEVPSSPLDVGPTQRPWLARAPPR